jgi:hypothetical protein
MYKYMGIMVCNRVQAYRVMACTSIRVIMACNRVMACTSIRVIMACNRVMACTSILVILVILM